MHIIIGKQGLPQHVAGRIKSLHKSESAREL